VDGTLLDPSQNLSPRVEAAVQRSLAAGVPLIVATGKARGPWADAVLPRLMSAAASASSSSSSSSYAPPPPPMPGVFLQGLLVADAQGRTLWSRSLEEEAVLAAIRLADRLGATLTCYCGDRIVAESLDEHTDRLLFYKEPVTEALGDLERLLARGELPAVQKVIFMASAERASAFRAEVEAAFSGGGGGGGGGNGGAAATGPRASVTTALPGMVELLPFGASKGAGLKWLLENALPPEVERRWRREQEEEREQQGGGGGGDLSAVVPGLMAMGDGENDREMLAMAEWSVAMGNAGEGLKSAARAVVATNADDGVAEAIERFVLADARRRRPAGVVL
jgi:hydroxymethylpyrimidine pyrophosphatase-like HAD family hydrolase